MFLFWIRLLDIGNVTRRRNIRFSPQKVVSWKLSATSCWRCRLSLLGDETFKIDAVKASKISTPNLRRRVYSENIMRLTSSKSTEHGDWGVPSFRYFKCNITLVMKIQKFWNSWLRLDIHWDVNACWVTRTPCPKLKPFGFLYDMKNEHLLPKAKIQRSHIDRKDEQSDTSSRRTLATQRRKRPRIRHWNSFTKQQGKKKPSLMQISSAHTCVLIQIDTETLPLELVEFLENPKIVKTGVGVLNDARELTRSFDNLKKVNGLVELQTWAEKGLSCKPVSLKALTGIYLWLKICTNHAKRSCRIGVLIDSTQIKETTQLQMHGSVERFFSNERIYGETRIVPKVLYCTVAYDLAFKLKNILGLFKQTWMWFVWNLRLCEWLWWMCGAY